MRESKSQTCRPFFHRVRALLFPRKGWRRVWLYTRLQILRIKDTPHRVALGFSLGVMLSFTPLFGLHLLITWGLCWAVRANMLAATLGTMIGNPVTFPLIALVSIKTGAFLLGLFGYEHAVQMPSVPWGWAWIKEVFQQMLVPYLVGGAVLGGVCTTASYIVVSRFVNAYHAARRRTMGGAK